MIEITLKLEEETAGLAVKSKAQGEGTPKERDLANFLCAGISHAATRYALSSRTVFESEATGKSAPGVQAALSQFQPPEAVLRAFERYATTPVSLELDVATLISLCANVIIGLKHPLNTGPTRQMVQEALEAIARGLADVHPALAEYVKEATL